MIQHAAFDAWKWARDNDFTNGTLKVLNEAQEFHAEPSLEEAADVLISLVVACQKLGWTLADLAEAAEAKMLVNRERTWAQAADGTFQHISYTEEQAEVINATGA